jgi:hypothetical protein
MQERKIGWFEKLLLRWFKHKDIRKRINGVQSVYLRRIYVFPKTTKDEERKNHWFVQLTGLSIFIHLILRSDEDRYVHDHPWPFFSLIFWNGYNEENLIRQIGNFFLTKIRVARIGTVTVHKATDAHRLLLHNGKPTWTLFVHGRRIREWGFHTPTGWVVWHKYFQEVKDDTEEKPSAEPY